LMPLWLLILGCQLPAAAAKSKETAQHRAAESSNPTQNGGSARPTSELT
jgi:hypothetical protein